MQNLPYIHTLSIILGLCEEGDVALGEDRTPFIFINSKEDKKGYKDSYENKGMWWPICGDFFKDNHHGATLFCQKLGDFANGKIAKLIETDKIPMDSYMIGKCDEKDKNLQRCTGGCNLRQIGGSCGEKQCTAENTVNIGIKCNYPKDAVALKQKKGIHSCKGIYLEKQKSYMEGRNF